MINDIEYTALVTLYLYKIVVLGSEPICCCCCSFDVVFIVANKIKLL